MSNSEAAAGGCLAISMIVISVVTWLGTGYIAYDWVEPEGFWGSIKFLIVWSILGYIAQLVGGLIVAGISSMFE
jgi:hypothetical protein